MGSRVRGAPRALLRAVPGLELVELGEAEMCCGSAGIYNLTEPVMAQRLLDRKMAHVEATGADDRGDGEPGLHPPAGGRPPRAGAATWRCCHVVEVLDRAYAGRRAARAVTDAGAPRSPARSPRRRAQGPRPRGCGASVCTVSDSKTPETDTSGRLIRELLAGAGHEVVSHHLVGTSRARSTR